MRQNLAPLYELLVLFRRHSTSIDDFGPIYNEIRRKIQNDGFYCFGMDPAIVLTVFDIMRREHVEEGLL